MTKPRGNCPTCHEPAGIDESGLLVEHWRRCSGSGELPTPTKAPQRQVETSAPSAAPTHVEAHGAPQEGGVVVLQALCRRHMAIANPMCPACLLEDRESELLTLRAEVDAMRAERVAGRVAERASWNSMGTGLSTPCPTMILSSDACGIESTSPPRPVRVATSALDLDEHAPNAPGDCDSPGIYVAPEVCTDTCWPETYPTREDGPDCDGPGDPPAQADCDEVNHG